MPIRYSDSEIIELWLDTQASPLTRDCYHRDAQRLLSHSRKPLTRIGLGDLHKFSQSLIAEGLAPHITGPHAGRRQSLSGFCQRIHFIAVNPAAELPLPRYEAHLAERILSEGAVERVLAGATGLRDQVLPNPLRGRPARF